jgi:hypothetical protein
MAEVFVSDRVRSICRHFPFVSEGQLRVHTQYMDVHAGQTCNVVMCRDGEK